MLFGFGFYVFLNKKTDTNGSIVATYLRRLAILLMFGVAHITLLWVGDVLLYYALFGFILVLFRNLSDKKLLRRAGFLIFLHIILTALMSALVVLASQVPEAKLQMDAQFSQSAADMKALIERATLVYSSGTFSEITAIRIEEYMGLLGGSLLFFCPVILGMFIIGFLAARKGLFTAPAGHTRFFKKVFWLGLAAGVVFNALYVVSYRYAVPSVPGIWSFLASSMLILGGFSLGMCYVAGIALLFIAGRSGFMVRYFVPVGKMALTNYLLQSLICVLLFHSYGLELYAKVEVWQGMLLTLVIFALQIAFSRWWLTHFQFGPFEYLWRSLTYFQLQPMRRRYGKSQDVCCKPILTKQILRLEKPKIIP